MSPREKHIPDDAQRTSICLTAEDRAAIHWIAESRKAKKNRRHTANDILVDALYHFLEREFGKTKDQIRQMVPVAPHKERFKSNVAEMPQPKGRQKP